MSNERRMGIGLLGLGTVGSGVVQMLADASERLERLSGAQAEIKRILVRDRAKERQVVVPPHLLTQEMRDILEDPEIHVVIEVMGGLERTHEYVRQSLAHGKHVITANKDLIAVHGAELQALAAHHGVALSYEAAVGGAVPIIRALQQSFAGDEIEEIMGIVNGTTNYILSKMTAEEAPYEEVLAEAQRLGYAEADPHADVSGLDAARKMAILATLAFGEPVALSDVAVQGIEEVTHADILLANGNKQVIKLIGRARRTADGLEVSVAPTALPATHPLAGVHDVFNAVYVYGKACGEAMFYGRGAGMMPTASAVIADLLAILRSTQVEQQSIVAGGVH